MLLTDEITSFSNRKMHFERLRILVLCTGNSARSIMAEALLNTIGATLFQAFSAGSHPTGVVNPLALEQIDQLDLPEDMIIRSKDWAEFTNSEDLRFDVVLTVCSNAAAEECSAFPGDYVHIHWPLVDPAGSSDQLEEERRAFAECFTELRKRVEKLAALPLESINKRSIISAMEQWSQHD